MIDLSLLHLRSKIVIVVKLPDSFCRLMSAIRVTSPLYPKMLSFWGASPTIWERCAFTISAPVKCTKVRKDILQTLCSTLMIPHAVGPNFKIF